MVSADDREYGFRVGYISTEHGVVGLYEQRGERPMTSLTMVARKRWLSATWNRTFSDRYLKTLANRFAVQHQGGGRG